MSHGPATACGAFGAFGAYEQGGATGAGNLHSGWLGCGNKKLPLG